MIDILETRKLGATPPDLRPHRAERLYGINKIRQLPLLAAAFVSSIGIGGLYLALVPVLAVEMVLFAKAAGRARAEFASGRIHYPRSIVALQIAEVLLTACILVTMRLSEFSR